MSDSAEAFRRALSDAAEKERAEIEREADETIAALSARAEAQAAREREEAFSSQDRAAAEEISRLRSQAEAERRAAVLAVKRRVMEEAFLAAKERLSALPRDDRYRKAIRTLAVEAARFAAPPNGLRDRPFGELRVHDADREAAAAALSAEGLDRLITIAAPKGSGDRPPGTVTVVSSDGRITVDNGFAARLERSRSFLSPAIAAVLFRGERP